MPKQPAFPGLRDALKKKRTRREQFLSEMDTVVPWDRLLKLIEPHYPKAGPKGGRPPMPLETMLRIYFLQNWYALSDPMAEEMLYDRWDGCRPPQTASQCAKMVVLKATACDLPALVIAEGRDLMEQIAEKTKRIDEKTRKLKALAAETDTARRLQTMPGVGPLTALAVEAFAPDMAQFKCGRDFAAWLGLVPRQHSSGGKERLGRISKAGQSDIRRLLIIGAMSRLNWLGRRSISEGSWLAKMLARKPKMLVAIALANKMARQIWAMLTKTEDYRDPALAAAT